MTPLQSGMLGASLLLLQILFLGCADCQDFGEQCLVEFKRGRDDFILDTDESVQHGATFVASPKVERYKDCIRACCTDPSCNVAFMESGADEGLIKSCFLFDCLYKMKYVCRFVSKKGYINYIRDAVYESYLAVDVPVDNEDDRPPVANGGPDRVVQPQDSVMLNGIESYDDHVTLFYLWEQVSGDLSAVVEKTNFEDQVIVSNLMSGVYKFRLTVTDTGGQSDYTEITVLVLTPEQSEHHCMAPMKIGPCRGSFPRWHYNAASEKCEQFTFGGCRENLNNYLSAQECANACLGSEKSSSSTRGLPVPIPKETCGVPCTAGQFPCANGCCLDPGLECDTVAQCTDGSDEVNCDDLNENFQILLQIPVDEQKVRCTEPPHTGTCRDSLTKWYYNPVHEECFRFNYGGCYGNENRFESKEACKRTCKGVTEKDIYVRQKEFERQVSESQTGIVAIAALLGISILILLGVLGYCFLKGKKQQPQRHQRVAVNGSQVTTIEDTERLVYNRTTKPI